MAATNYTPISLYYSATATNVPLAANLVAGELAINTNDGKLFYKDSSGVVQVMASKAGSVNVSSFSAGTTGFTPNTATTGAVTLAGTLATTNGGTGLTSFTANGVVYASSSSALATGSALVFDGTNFGLGVTPSAWYSTVRCMQLGSGGSIETRTNDATQISIGANYYLDASAVQRYISTNFASRMVQSDGKFLWFNAPSGTAGNAITFTQAMTLDASGNLGLGTTSPTTVSGIALCVYDSSAPRIRLTNSTTGNTSTVGGEFTIAGSDFIMENRTASANIRFYNNGSERARIDSSGNLGVGTTSPSTKLDVNPGSSGGAIRVYNSANTNTAKLTAQNSQSTIDMGQDGSGGFIEQAGAYPIRFYTNNSERARIDSSGNLLVGQTSSGVVNNNGVSSSGSAGSVAINHINGTGSGSVYMYYGYNGSTIGSITQSGTTAVLYNVTSDQRLKQNIQDADDSASLVDALQVRKFDWKADGNHQRYGFIAQELVTVAPEAVHQPADPDDMMAVDYSKLVPMLVKEIQSLRKRLAAAGI